MAKAGPLKRLKDYGRDRHSIADLWAAENEQAYGTSDRALAVLMGAMVESHLESWLLFNMNPSLSKEDADRMTGPEGVIGTFSRKITLAWAFQLIGRHTRRDLDLIRHIRNEFAHTRRPIDFKLQEVADVCAQLSFCDLEDEIPISYLQGAPDLEEAKSLKNARTRYVVTCHGISWRMIRLYLGPSDLDPPGPPPEPLP
jgi:hypothetical protein